jgi:hypothetical protein
MLNKAIERAGGFLQPQGMCGRYRRRTEEAELSQDGGSLNCQFETRGFLTSVLITCSV